MDIQTFIAIGMILIIALGCLIGSILSFRGRLMLSNTWTFATREQRKKMDRIAYQKQSAILLMLLAGVFSALTVNMATNSDFFYGMCITAALGAIVFGIASTIRIKRLQALNAGRNAQN